MSAKYCIVFPCKNLADPGSSYCQEHKPAAALKQTDKFYLSTRWRRFRDWYLANHPLCEQCEREGRIARADLVDHVIELRDGGSRLDESNAQALCWKCHAIKTQNELKRRKNHQKGKKENRLASAENTSYEETAE